MTAGGRLDAMERAQLLLQELDIDPEQPVDVYGAIVDLDLELIFADLGSVLGIALPDGPGGIVVTTKRPPTVQRYTAAHEIGHWALHHGLTLIDGESQILHASGGERERQAQVFASYFLMPPPLIAQVAARHGLRPHQVSAEQAYLMSRDMYVSYEAAIRRMEGAKLLTAAEASDLQRIARLDALRDYTGGHRPDKGRADVWSGGGIGATVDLTIRQGDEVIVQLPENRSSPFRWLDEQHMQSRAQHVRRPRPRPLTTGSHRKGLSGADAEDHGNGAAAPTRPVQRRALRADPNPPIPVVGDDFMADGTGPITHPRHGGNARRAQAEPPEQPAVAAAGTRTLVVRGDHPGEWPFQLDYTHAFDPKSPTMLTYRARITVQESAEDAQRRRNRTAFIDTRLDGDPDDDTIFLGTP